MAQNISELILRLRDEVSANAGAITGSLGRVQQSMATLQTSARQTALVDMIGGAGGIDAVNRASAGINDLSKSHESLSGASRPLKAALGQVIEQLGLGGPAAHVAAFGMLHLYEGITKVTVAAFAAAVGVGAAITSIKGVKESFKQIDESFDPKKLEQTGAIMADIREHINNMSTIGGRFKELFSDPIVTIGDKFANIFGRESGSEQKLAAIKMGQAAAVRQLTNALLEEAKAKQRVTEAELRGDTLGALAEQQAATLKAFRQQLTDKGVMGGALHEAAEAFRSSFPTDKQLAIIKTGMGLLDQGFKELGLDAGMTKAEMIPLAAQAFQLSESFRQGRITQVEMSAGLRVLAEDAIKSKTALGPLVEEIKGFIQVGNQKFSLKELVPAGGGPPIENQIRAALADARKELSELTKQGAALGFLPDPNKLQLLKEKLQGFGDLATKELGIDVPKDIQAAIQSFTGLTDALAKKYDIKLDATDFYSGINQANSALNNLRDNANNPIIIRTQTGTGGGKDTGTISLAEALARLGIPGVASPGIPAGQDLRAIQKAFLDFTPTVSESPAVPFSKWLNDIAPSKVQNFVDEVGDMGLNFNTDFSSAIVGTLNEIVMAKEAIARGSQPHFFSMGEVGDVTAGPRARLEALQQTLGFLQSMGTRSAAPSGGSGGGGGGPVTVNININGPITQELLDRQLVPKFERIIRAATGKNVDFRVLN